MVAEPFLQNRLFLPWQKRGIRVHWLVTTLLFLGIVLSYRSFRGPPKSHFAPTNEQDEKPHLHLHQKYGDLSKPDALFVSWPLARVCHEATWMQGVVFQCDNNSGGIGNIRNYILTCVRYAIEAGATGLVLPEIETRSEKDLEHLFGGHQQFEYFFDREHFRTSLAEACPRLVIYDMVEDVPHLHDQRAEKIRPKTFGKRGGCNDKDLNRHTDVFGVRFRDWLRTSADEFHLPPVSATHPRLFQLVWGVQWEWPAWKDGPEFANTFGGLLRFRQDVLELGHAMVAAMRRRASAASAAISPRYSSENVAGEYTGVHLRTEHDALSFWPAFDTQSTAYLEKIAERGLKAVYLATGNATEAKKFIDKATSSSIGRDSNVDVLSKYDLLEDQPELLHELRSMTWDQQALIDLIVLLESDYFLGVSPSSFSMTVAGKRHLQEDGIYTRPWKVGAPQGDGRSFLVGHYNSYWDDWLFMYDALWP